MDTILVACPLCSAQVAPSAVEKHIGNCLAEKQEKERQQKEAKEALARLEEFSKLQSQYAEYQAILAAKAEEEKKRLAALGVTPVQASPRSVGRTVTPSIGLFFNPSDPLPTPTPIQPLAQPPPPQSLVQPAPIGLPQEPPSQPPQQPEQPQQPPPQQQPQHTQAPAQVDIPFNPFGEFNPFAQTPQQPPQQQPQHTQQPAVPVQGGVTQVQPSSPQPARKVPEGWAVFPDISSTLAGTPSPALAGTPSPASAPEAAPGGTATATPAPAPTSATPVVPPLLPSPDPARRKRTRKVIQGPSRSMSQSSLPTRRPSSIDREKEASKAKNQQKDKKKKKKKKKQSKDKAQTPSGEAKGVAEERPKSPERTTKRKEDDFKSKSTEVRLPEKFSRKNSAPVGELHKKSHTRSSSEASKKGLAGTLGRSFWKKNPGSPPSSPLRTTSMRSPFSSPSLSARSPSQSPGRSPANGREVRWFWKNGDEWEKYDKSISDIIDKGYREGNLTVDISKDLFIDFRLLAQKSKSDPLRRCPIKRKIKVDRAGGADAEKEQKPQVDKKEEEAKVLEAEKMPPDFGGGDGAEKKKKKKKKKKKEV